jgi:tight adherence protein C
VTGLAAVGSGTVIGPGGLVGLGVGGGLALALSRLPVLRRPTLEDRLAPYLRDSASASRLLATRGTLTPFPTLERILAPFLRDGVRLLERAVGGGQSVRVRLDQAGKAISVEAFRAQQLLWGACGFLAALAVSVLLVADRGSAHALALLGCCLLAGVSGVLLRDRALSIEVTRRERHMMQEFPTVAELLALAVAAGDGPAGALERVARLSKGELARELVRALDDARAGSSLVQALERLGARTSLPPLARFVDGVAVAVERGTPLADVLRAQAMDAREAGKRALLESGGRKEIAMMIPVVFLVLPVTVVFALFPGVVGFSFAA